MTREIHNIIKEWKHEAGVRGLYLLITLILVLLILQYLQVIRAS